MRAEHQPDVAPEPTSYFAPAGRADPDRIRDLAERALGDPIVRAVMQAVAGYALIIDEHRQIIAASEALLTMLGAKANDSVLGLRPGEALGCLNANRGPDGCGTSVQCRHCGAVAAILAAQVDDKPIDGTCSLACCNAGHPKPTDFDIRVSPLRLGGARVYVFVFHDVTSSKRRELLERMFLHDLGNLATGLIGWSEELSEATLNDAAMQLVELAHRLGEQLEEQRVLVDFERGKASLAHERIDFDALIADLRIWFGAHECAKLRHFVVERSELPATFYTDRQLLLRILGNLLKNAFEAAPPDAMVTLRLGTVAERVSFEVHNPGNISLNLRRKLFKQRFSTKGPARGLGTHAVQFFGEQCLGGRVSFESTEEQGTVFRFELASSSAATGAG